LVPTERPRGCGPEDPVSLGAPSRATAADPGSGVRGSLPPQFTRFFGREAEIERLEAPLREDRAIPSLVTLTGPGGTGKTRLALEAAAWVRERFAGTIGFVSLVDLAEPGLIAGQLLDALRIPRSPGVPPFEQVVSALSAARSARGQSPPALLILDNMEHLLPDGAVVVQALLERVGSVSLWVTSRRSLGLPGERELPAGPLPVLDVRRQTPVKTNPPRPHWRLATHAWPLSWRLTSGV